MRDEWKTRLRAFAAGPKKAKALLLAGLCGILLLSLPVLSPEKQPADETPAGETTSAQYCDALERKIARLVTGITGSDDVQVAVTLDAGVQYLYTDETKTAASDSSEATDAGGKSAHSENAEQTCLTVRTADGGETALLRTEYMPTVRGVAVVCGGLTQSAATEIANAVGTALQISTKRVYVVGRASDEQGGVFR